MPISRTVWDPKLINPAFESEYIGDSDSRI